MTERPGDPRSDLSGNRPGPEPLGGLAGAVVLVTGGAQGIGRGVAEAFHAAGARVFVADLDGERAAEVAAGLDGSPTADGGGSPAARGPLIEVSTTAALAAEYVEILVASQPVHRMGTPGEIARACLFLADPASSFITGSVLDVDGGFLAGTALPPS